MNRKSTEKIADPATAVVVGTSAGGLQALQVLFGGLPGTFSPPIIVVMHVAADATRDRLDVLASATPLPLVEIYDKMPIRPGHIFIAPPNYHVLIETDFSFALCRGERVQYSRPAIDVLFETAAEAYRQRLIALLLTGANQDGTRGAERVRACGGMVLVQDPSEAEFPVMPLSAIERGVAHQVLPITGIISILIERNA